MTIEQEPKQRKNNKRGANTNAGAPLAERATASPPPAIRFTGGADAAAASDAEVRPIRTNDITTSSFNIPHRDPDEDLLASVKARGVIEPILVRPIPGGAVVTRSLPEATADIFEIEGMASTTLVHYEIVFGERRWKANRAAGHATLLCVVRELTDDEALDLQTEENLQRKDLDPMQEATVFALHQRRGADITTIAARVHKSERHVAQRLKLLELPDAEKAALILGKILLGTALELASLPKDLSQQDKDAALLLVMPGDSVLTVKEARARLTRRFYLRMAVAPFSTEDATLVPEAGSCMTCPKRTGTQMALTIDGLDNEDRCSDAACWGSKELATWRRKSEAASAKGIRVLDALSTNKGTVDQAHKVLNEMHRGALVSLDAPCDDLTDAEEAAAEKASEVAMESGDQDAIDRADERLTTLARRKKPTWREMLGDDVTPAAILRNRFYEAGKETTGIVELVDHRGALEKIRAKGATLHADVLAELEEPTAPTASREDDADDGRPKRERELLASNRINDRTEELLAAELRKMLVAIAESTPPRPGMTFWRAVLAGIVHGGTFDDFGPAEGIGGLFTSRGWPGFEDIDIDDVPEAILARADHMPEPKVRGLIVDVLCCMGAARAAMAARFEVDTDALTKKAREAAQLEANQAKAPEKKKKKSRKAGEGASAGRRPQPRRSPVSRKSKWEQEAFDTWKNLLRVDKAFAARASS